VSVEARDGCIENLVGPDTFLKVPPIVYQNSTKKLTLGQGYLLALLLRTLLFQKNTLRIKTTL